jgi:hypothetical protein
VHQLGLKLNLMELLLFHGNNDYENAPLRYVISTLSVFL